MRLARKKWRPFPQRDALDKGEGMGAEGGFKTVPNCRSHSSVTFTKEDGADGAAKRIAVPSTIRRPPDPRGKHDRP